MVDVYEVASRTMDRLMSMRHPLLFLIVVGILLRLAITPLSVVYDSEFWALVVRNIEAGWGLYGVDGYYYTPVWGYFLGLSAAFQDLFMNIGEVAVKVVELIPIEGLGLYFTSTIPSISFLFAVKVPLFALDLAASLMIWYLIKDVTNSDRKAIAGFGLMFFSSVVFLSSGVIAMPDIVSALFILLTVILLRKSHPFIAGMTFSVSVLSKFFPIFLLFVLVAYILANNRSDIRRGLVQVASSALGTMVMTLILLAPQIVEGDLAECFQFLSDRTGLATASSMFDTVTGALRMLTYVLVLLGAVYAGYFVYKNKENDLFETLMKGCLLVMALSLLYPPTTQYIVSLIPFLAFWIVVKNRNFFPAWILLSCGALVYVFASNAVVLMPMGVWWNIFDVGHLLEIFQLSSSGMGVITWRNVQFVIGGVLQCAGIISVLLIMRYGGLSNLLECIRPAKRNDGTS